MRSLKYKHISGVALVLALLLVCVLFSPAPVRIFAAPTVESGGGGGTFDDNSNSNTITCPKIYNGQDVPKQDQGKPIGESTGGSCGVGDLAADNTACQNDNSCQDIFDKYLKPFIRLLSAAVGILAVAAVIFGGIQFSASGGDPQKVANAKKHITNALIALVAYLLLFAFLNFIIPGGLLNDPSSTKTKNVNTPGASNTSGAIDSSSDTTTQNNSSGSFTGGGGGSF